MAANCSLQRRPACGCDRWTGRAIPSDGIASCSHAPRFEDLQFDSENPLYDVMPDGEHFVFLLEQSSSPTHYNIVLNWFEELKAKSQVR